MIERMFDAAREPDRRRVLDDLRRRMDSLALAPDGPRRWIPPRTVPAAAPPPAAPLPVVAGKSVPRESVLLEPVPGESVPRRSVLTQADPIRDEGRAGVFPVPDPLAAVLPRGGLPRGGVVSVTGAHGSTSLVLSLLAASPGAWSAVVGMPGLGLLAAAEFGVDLDRTVLIPEPGPDLLQVLSVLVDGVDLIVVRPPRGGVAPARLRVLTGRLRQRGAVLLVTGGWPGADLVLRTRITAWSGVGQGHGRLRDRELTVEVRGRGAAGHPRLATLELRSTRTAVQVVAAESAALGAVVDPRPEVVTVSRAG